MNFICIFFYSTNDYREGKYTNDLLNLGDHAIKGQNQMETRVNVPYTPMYERFVNKKIDFAKQVIPCFPDNT